jgi:hypothetical protein
VRIRVKGHERRSGVREQERENGGRVKFAVAQFWADPGVVISRAFFLFFPSNHIINIRTNVFLVPVK